jgi:hypothetical protein
LTDEGRSLWKRRTVTYFVFDRFTLDFAPSKFCAYVPVERIFDELSKRIVVEMTVKLYSTLETAPSFDGNRAKEHLIRNLSVKPYQPDEISEILPFFEIWLRKYSASLNIHPAGPVFLVPPDWLV